jgi:UDP-N-acetylglucosamine acyltransferase
VSGNTSIHQFVRLGRLAMVGGGARVPKDVPPFALVAQDGLICGLNVVGMRRAGFSGAERLVVKRVFHTLYHAGLNVRKAIAALRGREADPLTEEIVAFVTASRRGLAGWRRRSRKGSNEDAADDN